MGMFRVTKTKTRKSFGMAWGTSEYPKRVLVYFKLYFLSRIFSWEHIYER